MVSVAFARPPRHDDGVGHGWTDVYTAGPGILVSVDTQTLSQHRTPLKFPGQSMELPNPVSSAVPPGEYRPFTPESWQSPFL